MAIEILEQRLAPAGIVVATVSNGVLTLTGDALDNTVTVTEFAPDQFRITGGSETQISYNGTTAAEFEISGVGKGITGDFKGGNDGLVLEGVSLTGNLAAQMGTGEFDGLLLNGGTEIGGNITYGGGAGMDTFSVDGDLTVAGSTTINLGGGANTANFGTYTELILGKGLAINGGAGDDYILIGGPNVAITGNATFNMGAGGNIVYFQTPVLNISGTLSLANGAHAGLVAGLILQGESLSVGGSLTVTSGVGDSDVTLLAEDAINIAGSVNIQHGQGNGSVNFTAGDFIRVGGSFSMVNTGPNTAGFTQIQAPLVSVGGNLTLAHGTGLTNLDLSSGDNANRGLLNVGGNLAISFGGNTMEGATANLIAFQEIQVGGKFSVTAGNGLYVHSIDAGHLEAGGGVSIVNGNTVPRTLEGFYETVTYINAATLLTPSLSISNGNGNFTSGVTSALAQINGDMSIRNGAGGAVNTVEGAFAIGGNLRVINGVNAITNITATGALTVGGDLSIEHIGPLLGGVAINFSGGRIEVGDDLMVKTTTGAVNLLFTNSELIVGDDLNITEGNAPINGDILNLITPGALLRVGGDLTIRSGSADTLARHEIAADNVDIGGNVTVVSLRNPQSSGVELRGSTVAIGGRLEVLNSYNNSLGSVCVLALTGGDFTIGQRIDFINAVSQDTLQITVDSLTVANGDIRFRGGPGETTTTIESNSLNLNGNLNIAGGAGSDVLAISANGRISGSINAAFGTGAANEVRLRDAVEGGTGLIIGGTVNVAADYAGSRTLDIDDVTFLNLFRFTGGNTADVFSITDSQFTKGAYFNQQGGDDEFYFNSSSVSGSFTLLAGAGADWAEIGTSNDFPGAINFRGPVSIRMEGGDDRLAIGGEAPVTFYQRTTLDGGPGIDTLLRAEGPDAPVFLGTAPTVINFELFEDEGGGQG